MKRYLWIFAVLPFLWSCIAEDSSACPQPRGVSVRMSVCPDPMTAVPRAADEEALRDLNFYLLDADGNVVQHRYQSSPTLRFECLPGNYLLRIAANMGRDLGENPASEDFTVTHADEYDTLPMSYEGEVSIPSSDETVTLPTVEVQRVVAKITYNISVAQDAGDIRLHRILPVIKDIAVRTEADLAETQRYEGCCTALLFDTKTERFGGSGRRFDWNILNAYSGETPFLLSGGIGPGDAERLQAVRHPQLAGVDVNSLFESEPGHKECDLLQPFIEQLKTL